MIERISVFLAASALTAVSSTSEQTPLHDVNVIERPAIVFKNGVGYDSIYASIAGQVGLH